MKIRLFQIDAFASRLFAGNPAAVVPLERWLDDATLQAIAAENNLSDTAFFVGANGAYEIRWMTPSQEVDLCGHATLASGWVVMNALEPGRREVEFRSRSGPLRVRRGASGWRSTSRHSRPSRRTTRGRSWPRRSAARRRCFSPRAPISPSSTRRRRSAGSSPTWQGRRGSTATESSSPLPGGDCDFVSRFFVPGAGVPEDPVTGSAHCTLVPYWSKRLGKPRLFARQVSRRGGELWCEDRGERVEIAGHAVKFLEGVIELP